jgi:hypothetical protein
MVGRDRDIHVPYRDITRDPREDEDWFQRLPPEVQERTREGWRTRRVQFVPWHARNRELRKRCLGEGVCVCVLPTLLMVGTSWTLVLAAVPGGLVTGWLWWRLGTDRISSGLVAMLVVLVVVLASGVWSSRFDAVWLFNTGFGMFLAGLLGSAMGLRREIWRREHAL